jgi:hypothetical protein
MMDPTESSELAAAAVEVVHGVASSRFVHGVAVGVAASAVLAHLWLAVVLADAAKMYRDFADFAMPPLTRLVTATPWLWGVPAVGAVVVAWLVARRARSLVGYVVVAALLVATLVGTWHFAQAPIAELADNIRE